MSDESNFSEDASMEGNIRPATDDEMPLSITPQDEGDDIEPISLVEGPQDDTEHAKVKVKQAGRSVLTAGHTEYKRPLNLTGKGATRCKIFQSRIALESLENLEKRINNWVDNEEIDIKNVGHVLGVMEGKNPKPNIVVIAWY